LRSSIRALRYRGGATSWPLRRPVLLVPEHWLPEFDLVVVRVHDPGELAVLVGLWSLHDLDPRGLQLREQGVEIIDSVIDHERRCTRGKPSGTPLRHAPDGKPLVFGFVV